MGVKASVGASGRHDERAVLRRDASRPLGPAPRSPDAAGPRRRADHRSRRVLDGSGRPGNPLPPAGRAGPAGRRHRCARSGLRLRPDRGRPGAASTDHEGLGRRRERTCRGPDPRQRRPPRPRPPAGRAHRHPCQTALEFDGIWSNPPVRVGKDALHELLAQWLPRLRVGAHAYLVVQKNLGADSLQSWLRNQGWPTTRLGSRAGYRLLDVVREAA